MGSVPGRPHPHVGHPQSAETKAKISRAQIARHRALGQGPDPERGEPRGGPSAHPQGSRQPSSQPHPPSGHRQPSSPPKPAKRKFGESTKGAFARGWNAGAKGSALPQLGGGSAKKAVKKVVKKATPSAPRPNVPRPTPRRRRP